MDINKDNRGLWDEDIKKSVDMYNQWFMNFAPKVFRDIRVKTAALVEQALKDTNYLLDISNDVLMQHPEVLMILRMATCPPIARDRLVGLAGVSKSLVMNMENSENPKIPPRFDEARLREELTKIAMTILKLADPDIFVWLADRRCPTEFEIQRASTIVADRLCSAMTDPIIRNEQEKRQLSVIAGYLEERGYSFNQTQVKYNEMEPGTFSYHTNVPVKVADSSDRTINIPVDVLIMPKSGKQGDIPILIEAKSAGDFANVNKRRKEEAVKMQQLRLTYGRLTAYCLFLCGYFDTGYLEYEADEGIDWIWEHRVDDLEKLGI